MIWRGRWGGRRWICVIWTRSILKHRYQIPAWTGRWIDEPYLLSALLNSLLALSTLIWLSKSTPSSGSMYLTLARVGTDASSSLESSFYSAWHEWKGIKDKSYSTHIHFWGRIYVLGLIYIGCGILSILGGQSPNKTKKRKYERYLVSLRTCSHSSWQYKGIYVE